MRIIRFLLIALIATLVVPVGACAQNKRVNAKRSHRSRLATTVIVGAERTDQYLPLLRGKRIALLSNQTGVVGRNHDKHTLDLMLENTISK